MKPIVSLNELSQPLHDKKEARERETNWYLNNPLYVPVRVSLPLAHTALARAHRLTKQHKGVVTQRTVIKGRADQIGAIGEAVFASYVGTIPDATLYGKGQQDPGFDFILYGRTFDVKATVGGGRYLYIKRSRAKADYYVLVKLILPRWAVICGAIYLKDFDEISEPHETVKGVRQADVRHLAHIDHVLGYVGRQSRRQRHKK